MNQIQVKDELSQALIASDVQSKAERIFDFLDVSETTRAEYKSRIGLFLEFLEENGLNRNSFLDFKRSMASRNDLSISTKNKYLSTAKIFLKELNRQDALPSDITQNIKIFSQSKKHKREGLNDEEIRVLMGKVRSLPATPANIRLRAILSLLILQGLRQIEIVRLDVKDLDLVAKTAFIQGKGEDDKELINLHPETVKVLREYLKTNKIADGPLFVSLKSNNKSKQRLTTRGLQKIIMKLFDELGIEKSTHGFRHFFTTRLIRTYKGDLLEVARYTRHKSLEMLQVYNDNIKLKADLPRFYSTFEDVSFE